jgi:hypothetical protein
MKEQNQKPSLDAINQLINATKEDGGALLKNGKVLRGSFEPIDDAGLESYPVGKPLPHELASRKMLCRWARRMLKISCDEHPLCLQALATLADFCDGRAGYRDLAIARARLWGRAGAAWGVGLGHGCANAAATLACFHACDPDLIEAIRETKSFVRLTVKFKRDRHQSKQRP